MKATGKNRLIGGLGLIFLCCVNLTAQPGMLDFSFGDFGKVNTDFGGAEEIAYDLAVQPDGKIVVVGTTLSSGKLDTAGVRYTSGNLLDTSFSDDGKLVRAFKNSVIVNDVRIQPNGIVIVGGRPSRFARLSSITI